MKNILIASLLLVATTSANAAEVDVSVSAASDYLYRGQTVTQGEPTVYGSLTLKDVVVPNVYLRGEGVVLNLAPYEEDKTLRSEFGVGYRKSFGQLDFDLSVNRVFNPVLYAKDYNEGRFEVNWNATDKVDVFGRVAHIVSDGVANDSYVAVGVKKQDFFVDKLSVSALASTFRSDATASYAFNNFELTAEYELAKGLYAFGTYSVGGATVRDAFDEEVKFDAVEIPSAGMVGFTYRF